MTRYFLALVATVSFAQTRTTVCEIAAQPADFHQQIVTVPARVLIGFETFQLATQDCPGNPQSIWLEYGSGPKRQPAVWCCGAHTPRDPLRVVQNRDFRTFHHLLRSRSMREQVEVVSTTLTGRIDAASTTLCPDGKSRCCTAGFGHLGASCARLVIQSVSDVKGQTQPAPAFATSAKTSSASSADHEK